MLGLKKRDIKRALKYGAKAGGSSYADVRADIESMIDKAMNNTDPEVQANYSKLYLRGWWFYWLKINYGFCVLYVAVRHE